MVAGIPLAIIYNQDLIIGVVIFKIIGISAQSFAVHFAVRGYHQ